MKALSTREYQILHFLLKRRDFVPVKEIAGHMNWSEKTIYRELNALEHNLHIRGIRLERKPGRGIALALTQEQTMELRRTQWTSGKRVVTTLSVEARRIKILTNLLYDSPEETSINKLSEQSPLEYPVPVIRLIDGPHSDLWWIPWHNRIFS